MAKMKYGTHPGYEPTDAAFAPIVKFAFWLAVFTAIEVKAPGGRLREEQRLFLSLVERCGGYGGVARSVEEAARVLRLS